MNKLLSFIMTFLLKVVAYNKNARYNSNEYTDEAWLEFGKLSIATTQGCNVMDLLSFSIQWGMRTILYFCQVEGRFEFRIGSPKRNTLTF